VNNFDAYTFALLLHRIDEWGSLARTENEQGTVTKDSDEVRCVLADLLKFCYRLKFEDCYQAAVLSDQRNRVVHTREEYDRNQALSVFNHLCDFMQILASKISEKERMPLVWKKP
jgi:hypothetical protein